MYDTLWEFRVHKNDVTQHTGFKGQGEHHNINLGPEQFGIRVWGQQRLQITDVRGRLITEYPLSHTKSYPEFTEIPVLLDGDRYLFEYRYTELT